MGAGGSATAFQARVSCRTTAREPQEVTTGADGAVWFDELGSVFAPAGIGRATAPTGVISENPAAVQPGWKPFGITFGPDGAYAYVQARPPGVQEWLSIVHPAGVKVPRP